AYTPTDASNKASAPNADINTTGKRRGANVVPTTSSRVATSYIGRPASIVAIVRRTVAVSATGLVDVRIMTLSPNGCCRCAKNIMGSGLSRVGSFREPPTTPMIVIHGAFGFGGP